MRHVIKLRRIDFYKKYTNEDRIPTIFGAFMSLLAIIIITVLTMLELTKYLYPYVDHKVGLVQFPIGGHQNTVPFNFDINFDNVPCACIVFCNDSSSNDFAE